MPENTSKSEARASHRMQEGNAGETTFNPPVIVQSPRDAGTKRILDGGGFPTSRTCVCVTALTAAAEDTRFLGDPWRRRGWGRGWGQFIRVFLRC